MRSSRSASLWSRFIRNALIILVLMVLFNEGVRYVQAYQAIYLALRDAQAAIGSAVDSAPQSREVAARAAATQCARYGAVLETYDQQCNTGPVGYVVVARLTLSRPLTGAVISPMLMAAKDDLSLGTWRSRQPIVRFSWQQQFSKVQ